MNKFEQTIQTSENIEQLNKLLKNIPLAQSGTIPPEEKIRYINMIKQRMDYLKGLLFIIIWMAISI